MEIDWTRSAKGMVDRSHLEHILCWSGEKSFEERYIEEQGKYVRCCNWRYPISLKQAELMCAEKGPRRSRRSAQQSGVANSTSRSPMTPRSPITPRSPMTPRSPHAIGSTNEHSFMSSSFSHFSPHHINNLPF
ncbi:hypothetical protein P8452_43917 [Trifolium repens]|nr:hypothetical protein P8452_43917 [Trifolium repens]